MQYVSKGSRGLHAAHPRPHLMQSLGFRVLGFGLRVLGLGFRILGLGLLATL